MPNSHVDDKKGKKPWYIRGGKTEKEKEGKGGKEHDKKRKGKSHL